MRPDLASAGETLFYYFAGVGLGFLGTTRRDGGPRVHPVCPLLHDGGLYAFIIPSPKLADLSRDGRYALHSYPLPDNEDAFYVTGRVEVVTDGALREAATGAYMAERPGIDLSGIGRQTLVEFLVESCLLTRTTGHGDPLPQHTVWHSG